MSEWSWGSSRYFTFSKYRGFPSSTNIQVSNEVWLLGKDFPTVTIFIRFFTSMNSLICNQEWLWSEGLSTFTLNISSLCSPSLLVYKEIWSFGEDLRTSCASKGFYPVWVFLCSCIWFGRERCPIVTAFIWLLSTMNFLMCNQVGLLDKSLPTFSAYAGFHSCMNSLMQPHYWLMSETLITFIAFIGLSHRIGWTKRCGFWVKTFPHSLHT